MRDTEQLDAHLGSIDIEHAVAHLSERLAEPDALRFIVAGSQGRRGLAVACQFKVATVSDPDLPDPFPQAQPKAAHPAPSLSDAAIISSMLPRKPSMPATSSTPPMAWAHDS